MRIKILVHVTNWLYVYADYKPLVAYPRYITVLSVVGSHIEPVEREGEGEIGTWCKYCTTL